MSDIVKDMGMAIIAQERGMTDMANRYWAQIAERLDGLPLQVCITLPDGVTKITVTAVVTIEAPEAQP